MSLYSGQERGLEILKSIPRGETLLIRLFIICIHCLLGNLYTATQLSSHRKMTFIQQPINPRWRKSSVCNPFIKEFHPSKPEAKNSKQTGAYICIKRN